MLGQMSMILDPSRTLLKFLEQMQLFGYCQYLQQREMELYGQETNDYIFLCQ